MNQPNPTSDEKRTKEARLFRNNRSQAVRIPVEFELPGESVLIHREGDRLILEPVRNSSGLLNLISQWEPLDDEFPEIEDQAVEQEDVF